MRKMCVCKQGAQMIGENSMTCDPGTRGFGQEGVAHTGQGTAGSRKSVWKTVESQPMHGHLTKTQFCGSVAKAEKKRKPKREKEKQKETRNTLIPRFPPHERSKKTPPKGRKKSLKQAFSNGKW